MARLVRAAGGVVFRRNPAAADPEFLVVRRPRYKDWTLPKGKIERGEGAAEAAFREVREETGFHCRPIVELGSIGYQLRSGRHKAVRYWLMAADDGEFRKNKEVDKVLWLEEKDAVKKLSFQKDRDVLKWAAELADDPQRGRIHLVRHGAAGARSETKSDKKRRLSKKGSRHADKIGRRLSRIPVERIISSSYPRCTDTVKPLASLNGTAIETDGRLVEGAQLEDTLALVEELQGLATVLCSHGDVIENVIGDLAAQGVPLDAEPTWPKGSVWTLETRGGHVISGHFRKPPK